MTSKEKIEYYLDLLAIASEDEFSGFDADWLMRLEVEFSRLDENAMEIINSLDEFPEDNWFSLDDEYDLNLFVDDGAEQARIYPVVDGRIDTERSLNVAFI